jgi:uncharacterized protein DUF4154
MYFQAEEFMRKNTTCISKASIFLMNFILVLIFLVPTFYDHAWGGSTEEIERRLMVGLELFPNIVSIDLDLSDKRQPDGSLLLLIIYQESGSRAEKIADKLRTSVGSIHQFPVKIQILHHRFDSFPDHQRPCAVFLLDSIPETSFNRIRQLAIDQHFILFSPYEQDLKRGATVGLKITSRIKPVINKNTLRKSTIRLHDEFLRLAETYE